MEFVNNAPGAPKPVGPYSQAVQAGDLVFLSGQVGIDPATGKLVEGGVEAQAKQVFQNLSAVLKAAEVGLDQVVMVSVFLASIADFPTVNKLYENFVNKDAPPARQTMAVKELPLGALIEISLIAAV